METIRMSKREIYRMEIISQTVAGKVKQGDASKTLGISLRQTKRLCKKFRLEGAAGLVHKNRGRISNNKISVERKERILKLIKLNYLDFGPQLIHEQLKKRHGIDLSSEWIRLAMIEEEMWIPKKSNRIKLYQRRNRRSKKGELIQIDGSYHDWLEGRGPKCCLLVAIDDATSELLGLKFEDHETTKAYMDLMKRYIRNHGRPIALYSDRLNIFRGKDCQFKRALKELDIDLINANSPQAKGRVERANATLQDRLIKLMRLEGINTIEEANEYLESYRLDHNKRYGRRANKSENAHRDVSKGVKLEKILCTKEERKLSKNLSLQFKHKTYCLKRKSEKRRFYGKTAQIYEIAGKVHIEVDNEEFDYTIYEEQPYQNTPMNRKQVDAWLDKKPALTAIQRHRLSIRGS